MISSLSSSGGHGGAALRQQLFKKIDSNGDSSLTKDELLAALGKSNEGDSTGTSDKLEKLFSKLDQNSDGTLSQDEFSALQPPQPRFGSGVSQALLSQQEADGAPPSATDLFAKADSNGDGSLSEDELSTLLANGPGGQQAADKAAKELSRLDSNGDGSVSTEEFAAGQPQGNGPPPPGGSDGDSDIDALLSALNDSDATSGTSAAAKAFSKLDVNGDGQISATEWSQATQQGGGVNNTSSNLSVGRMDSQMLSYLLHNENQQAA